MGVWSSMVVDAHFFDMSLNPLSNIKHPVDGLDRRST
jgi:hypothetical protein